MKRRRRLAVLLTGLALLIFATPGFAAKATITGKISKDMKILSDDGTAYNIAKDDMGDTLMVYAGKTVQVTGKVKEDAGKKTIVVYEFKVVQ